MAEAKSRSRLRAGLSGGRLGRIAAGYAAACLVAALTLPVGLILRDAVVLGAGKAFGSVHLGDFAVVALFTFLIALVAAAPFAVAFIMTAEAKNIRAAIAYVAFGGLTAVVVEALGIAMGIAAPSKSGLTILALFFVVGMIAGAVYWAIAVRRRPAPARG